MQNTRYFECALTLWESKTASDRAWNFFKPHFHESQHTLKKIRGPTVNQAGHHHANMIVSQIRKDVNKKLESRNNEVLSVLRSIPSLTSVGYKLDYS